MSESNLPPTVARELTALKQRVDALERVLRKRPPKPRRPFVVFSMDGIPFLKESGPLDLIEGGRLTDWRVLLGTPPDAGDSLEVELRINGAAVSTIEMLPGDVKRTKRIDLDLAPDSDRLTVAVVDVGRTACDMVATVYTDNPLTFER